MLRRQFVRWGSISATPLSASAFAQPRYPERAIQMLVGFPGGGALDVATRVVTNALAEEGLGPIAVINKPGASATIAAGQAAIAAADGHTALLATSANMGIAPFMYPKLPYAPDKDLVPVARFAVGQNVIYCGRRAGVTDFRQLRARIASAPGKLNYASPGAGTTPHLCFEMLKARDRLFIVHVPFRGSPAAITSVLSGEVDLGVDAIGPTLGHVAAGRLVPLAQTGERRSASLPDVPTLAELGIDGIPSGTYLGFMLPAGTPAPILDRWSEAVRRVTSEPAVVNQLRQLGMDAAYLDARRFAAVMADERRLWEGAVKYSGATA